MNWRLWKFWHAGDDARARHNACGAMKAFGNDTGARARWVDTHVCEAAS